MKSICSCTHCATVSCQVIIKLSDQVTACLSEPRRPDSSSAGRINSQTLRQLRQENNNLKVKHSDNLQRITVLLEGTECK